MRFGQEFCLSRNVSQVKNAHDKFSYARFLLWLLLLGRKEPQISGNRGIRLITDVFGMDGSVKHHHVVKVKRADPFQAGGIDAKLIGCGSSLMMGIYTANRTKIVFRRFGFELIKRQLIGARYDLKISELG